MVSGEAHDMFSVFERTCFPASGLGRGRRMSWGSLTLPGHVSRFHECDFA